MLANFVLKNSCDFFLQRKCSELLLILINICLKRFMCLIFKLKILKYRVDFLKFTFCY